MSVGAWVKLFDSGSGFGREQVSLNLELDRVYVDRILEFINKGDNYLPN
ncbi:MULTISPECIES: hypothetical protein [Microcoleaceae]|nr:hypothetical protein [Tychonema sp. LEGE 06208]MBE9161256.1 hypothetical protein [Tychonema sp. LEGE 06208]